MTIEVMKAAERNAREHADALAQARELLASPERQEAAAETIGARLRVLAAADRRRAE